MAAPLTPTRGGPAGPRLSTTPLSTTLPQPPHQLAGRPRCGRAAVTAASFLEGLFGRCVFNVCVCPLSVRHGSGSSYRCGQGPSFPDKKKHPLVSSSHKQSHSKPGAAPVPPSPSSASPSGAPPPRFPPPTPAPDGSLPPPAPGVTRLGLPDVAIASLDPLALAPPGDGRQPTHSLCLVLGPDALDPTAMAALTAAAGWPARPPDRLAAALAGSYLCAGVVLAPLGDGSGGGAAGGGPPILVGAARATSDAAFNATLWDVLVHPAMRGRGVGAALVERVTAALLAAGLGNVTLFSTRGALPFYSGLGYAADPEGIRGMFYVGEGK